MLVVTNGLGMTVAQLARAVPSPTPERAHLEESAGMVPPRHDVNRGTADLNLGDTGGELVVADRFRAAQTELEACGWGNDCGHDLMCMNETDLGGKACVYNTGHRCDADAECYSSYICRPQYPGASETCLSAGGIGEGCAVDGDCRSGLTCLYNYGNGGSACVAL